MEPVGTLIIKRAEVASLLHLGECIEAVEDAFRLNEEGRSLSPGVLETMAEDGGFHIKAAGLKLSSRTYFAAKVNANFPQNVIRRGLPAIQGSIVLFDGESGRRRPFWIRLRSRPFLRTARSKSINLTSARAACAASVAGARVVRPSSLASTCAEMAALASSRIALPGVRLTNVPQPATRHGQRLSQRAFWSGEPCPLSTGSRSRHAEPVWSSRSFPRVAFSSSCARRSRPPPHLSAPAPHARPRLEPLL